MPISKELETRAGKVAKELMKPMPKEPLKVIAGAPDRPLIIGEVEIQCYVLEDETRVLSQRGMFQGFGATRGGGGGAKMPRFLSRKSVSPFISDELAAALEFPIEFQLSTGGGLAHGYPAVLLPKICEVFLKARDAGALRAEQMNVAERADVLVRALATVGVIALVDEATGYQEIREKNALATILEKYIADEWQPWTKTFPYEFYEQIFRLRGWPGPDGAKRPSVIGHYTNDFVYKRLYPGLLERLRQQNPKLPSGNRSHKHTQWFTPEFGHPELLRHIGGVIALMKISGSWDSFKRKLDQAFTKPGKTSQLLLEGEPE